MTLRVTFDIVPFGEEINKYNIGGLEIYNTGGGALGFCTYDAALFSDGGTILKEVKNINHSRQDGFQVLTRKVLEALEQDTPSNS
jgi:hypothetical protein